MHPDRGRWCSFLGYERSAQSFDNPDHVAIVIHNYRWRLGPAEGEARFDALEAKLEAGR